MRESGVSFKRKAKVQKKKMRLIVTKKRAESVRYIVKRRRKTKEKARRE